MKNKIKRTIPVWKVGDWCFHNADLKQVTTVIGGNVTLLSDGFFNSSYHNFNDEIFPLTIKNKNLSDYIRNYIRPIREHKLINILNWPDILFYFRSLFIDGCRKENDEEIYKKVADFGNNVCIELDKIKCLKINGIQII